MRQLLLAAILAPLLTACGGAELEPWHTVELEEEYGRGTADDIGSFDDYLELEARMFAELDREIYAHTDTGPEHTLNRYSAGSAADPRKREPDWNRSFELVPDQSRGGVLLLHGMSDSPYSLRALGQALHDRGYRVLGLRLPGHGTIPSGLKSVRWQDMAGSVALAMAHLADRLPGQSIHIIGYSTGAPLALQFALDVEEQNAQPMPASLVLFDINRSAIASPLLVADPGPLTRRLLDESLPFALTLVGNDTAYSTAVVARHRLPHSTAMKQSYPLENSWPRGVVSLSHVALPFPVEDPLYGRIPPAEEGQLYLGQLPLQGERGLLRISSDWLLRLRHNPFYDYLEKRAIDWIDGAGQSVRGSPAGP